MRKIVICFAVTLLISIVLVFKASTLEECNWSTYMMNPHHNAIVPDSCGVDPSKMVLLWKHKTNNIETQGRSIEAPAVYKDGFVFYGRYTQTAHETYKCDFVKADSNTGDIKWRFSIDNANPNQNAKEFFVCGLSSSPLIHEDRIYLCCVNSDIFCLDITDGSLIWKFKNSTPTQDKNHDPKEGSYIRSSPVIYKNQLLVAISYSGTDPKFNIRTGAFDIFSIDVSTGIGKKLLSTDAYYFDRQTKDYIPPDPMAMRSSLTLANDKLLVNTTISLICFDLASSKIVWDTAGNAKHPYFCTPSVYMGKVFYGGPDKDFTCLDLESGNLIWSSNSKLSIRSSSTPLVYKDRVIIPHRAGKILSLGNDGSDVIWSFQCKDTINSVCSSPVLSNSNVWFGTNDRNLYCLNVENGKLVKSLELDGAIIAPPVIADKKIFIGTVNGTFYCYGELTSNPETSHIQSQSAPNTWTCFMGDMQHTGFAKPEAGPKTDDLEKHWEYPTGFWVVPTVLVADGMAFAGSQDNYMRAIGLADGLEIWRTKVGKKCHHDKRVEIDELKYGGVVSTPVYVGGKLFFGTICYKVLCLDAKTGSIIWEYDDPEREEFFNTPMVYYDGKLYTISAERLYCIDAATGKRLWLKAVWSNSYSAPMFAEGRVYAAGIRQIKCFDAVTGDEILKDGFVHDGKTIEIASPSYKDGMVYFGCMDSDYICFDAKTGKEVWRSREGRAITAGCLTDDKIYFGDIFSNVTCLDIKTGYKLWKFDPDNPVYGAPVFCNGRIYFGSAKGTFYCVETKFGKLIWKYNVIEAKWVNPFAMAFACSPSVAGGKVYIGGVDGNVYCFGDLRKGLVLDRVKVTAPSAMVMAGRNLKLKATAYSKDGTLMDAKFVWTVEPESLGTVEDDGTFRAGDKAGTVFVKACFQGKCDGVKIAIREPKDIVASVSVDPKSAKVFVGAQASFEATAFDGAGNPVDGVEFSWKAEPATLGSVTNGIFTALKSGKGKIAATVGARSGSAQVQVVKPMRMAVDPESADMVAGASRQFTANVFDDLDEIIEDVNVSWSVEPESLGTVNDDGLFISKVAGQGSVKAEFMGLSSASAVTVASPPKSEITVEPASLDFGLLHPDSAKTLKIKIKNNGDAPDRLTLASDSDWIKVSPESIDLEAGGESTSDISLSLAGKARGASLEGAVKVASLSKTFEIPVKAKVAPQEQCLSVKDSDLKGEIPPGVVTTKSIVADSPRGVLEAEITSTNPLVTAKNPRMKIGKSTQIDISIDATALKPGETIAGSLSLRAGDNCLQVTLYYLFTVKANEIRIWLQIGNPTARIGGTETRLQAPPVILKGSTLVPLRFIAEAFGCKVDWNQELKQITITKDRFVVVLVVGNPKAIVAGKELAMKSPPTSIDGRTFVPLRFIAEAFGATVNFNSETREIDIIYTP